MDRFLPGILGRIRETYRTPMAALWAGGLITAASVSSGNLTFIVKSANFCSLASLLPISLALRPLAWSIGTCISRQGFLP